MIGVHTVEEIRAAEDALMARLPDGALMQRAVAGLVTVCAGLLDGVYGARVVVLAGAGNNGGDALWAGARLARRGAHADAVLLNPDKAHAEGLAAFRAAGGRLVDLGAAAGALAAADLVLDGILGIGGRGGLRGDAAELAALLRAGRTAGAVVAVDLSSGVDPDTGETPGEHVVADHTVTFGTGKTALVVDPAATVAGVVHHVDIGLGPYLPSPELTVLDDADVATLLPDPGRESDKYSRGVVGVLAGSAQFPGAAVLAVGGALHGGAGMVRYAGPDAVAVEVRQRWPEAIAGPSPDVVGRVQAWTVGSGLGDGREDDVRAALGAGLPVLVDADGLRGLPERFAGPALLTPHAGELARLLGVERAEVEARRLHHARAAATRWNAVVLLKGSTTVVAAPDGRVRVNPTGTSALAAAGTGDVLAGLAGSLLAGGLSPLDAGSVAAYAHGLAGQRAAAGSGYPSAADVLAALPGVLRSLRGVVGAGAVHPLTAE
ncbi:NAD(P)H-hydrate dehydratase [Jiangella alkaliphila]|uniref:Bifunctional NAD(P)H-hydrate repair enzyme n=1 Tax=Jiangella alkaliphila TaxID=419479 RepID=A0A1H2M764_9ACTN|nr:NAD(P)H-hydrate dehydratase [Jiangella alkaliphila]SDU88741.1 yjeF C-terminal region, hydroxyethylthiazole kinase-related/yjeF N-terminal region [Jiangella alkaliphila]